MNQAVTALLVLAGALVTLDAAVRVTSTVFGRTVGHAWRAKQQFRQLGANETGRYFEAILGVPAVERDHGKLHERVWADRLYFVQALTESDDRVVVYSITSRTQRFRIAVPFPGGGKYWSDQSAPLTATLGKSSFLDAGADPQRVSGSRGARRFWYSEVFGFGNPGHYQHLILSVNDAGFISDGSSDLISESPVVGGPETDLSAAVLPAMAGAREQARPNTYSVTAPHFDALSPEAHEGAFGVDLDTVRVLPVW